MVKVFLKNEHKEGARGHGDLILQPGESIPVDLPETELQTIEAMGHLAISAPEVDQAAEDKAAVGASSKGKR